MNRDAISKQNCFLDFAVEYWFGCRATDPGFAGNIGAIEVWLIDCLINRSGSWIWLHCRIRVNEHITPVFMGLHWLPVQQMIQYKILLLAYRPQNGYISELLQSYQTSHTLRSVTEGLRLSELRVATSWGERACSRAALLLWRGLPLSVRYADSLNSFKSMLKTHLFQCAFCWA